MPFAVRYTHSVFCSNLLKNAWKIVGFRLPIFGEFFADSGCEDIHKYVSSEGWAEGTVANCRGYCTGPRFIVEQRIQRTDEERMNYLIETAGSYMPSPIAIQGSQTVLITRENIDIILDYLDNEDK